MKKHFLILFFALNFINSNAQEIPNQTVKSEIFKDEYKYSSIVLVDDDGNGGILIVRTYFGGVFSSGSGYYFEHYDANMKLIKEYEYERVQKKSDKKTVGTILGIILDNQTVRLIDYVYSKTDKAFICNALSSSINDFNFTSQELFRVNSEEIKRPPMVSFMGIGSGYRNYDDDAGANMIINEDRTAFSISIDVNDNKAETHKMYLFDKSLNKK